MNMDYVILDRIHAMLSCKDTLSKEENDIYQLVNARVQQKRLQEACNDAKLELREVLGLNSLCSPSKKEKHK